MRSSIQTGTLVTVSVAHDEIEQWLLHHCCGHTDIIHTLASLALPTSPNHKCTAGGKNTTYSNKLMKCNIIPMKKEARV